ncbi:MBOAT family protein [Desulfopila sp. IMCC35008]|uniref:MBOAT family protein n=1 Tax=Desulfopila sp. IMCC35008 TaxID=2653858 RepID=UPI0013D07E32|nr:MBOAT family protein [Desulfopila sp. IMCC35008]
MSFFFAPSLCFSSWHNRRQVCRKDFFVLAAKSFFFCLLLGFIFFFELRIPPDLPPWLQGYLAVIPFWLMLEMVQALLQVLWMPAGRLVPPVNVHPIFSASVSEFWGRRWNRLFGDWLYEICFKPFFRAPVMGLLLAFVISGLLHELLVSLPYLVVYGKSLFGLMLVYFVIQFLAILIERKWLAASPVAGRIYCWLVVLGPAPMVLNSGTLRIFQMVGSC